MNKEIMEALNSVGINVDESIATESVNEEVSELDEELAYCADIEEYERSAYTAAMDETMITVESLATALATREASMMKCSFESVSSSFGISTEAIDIKDIFSKIINALINMFNRLLGIKKIESRVVKDITVKVRDAETRLTSIKWETTEYKNLLFPLIFEALRYNTIVAIYGGRNALGEYVLDKELERFMDTDMFNKVAAAIDAKYGSNGFAELIRHLGTSAKIELDIDVLVKHIETLKQDANLDELIEMQDTYKLKTEILKKFNSYSKPIVSNEKIESLDNRAMVDLAIHMIKTICEELLRTENDKKFVQSINLLKSLQKTQFDKTDDKEYNKKLKEAKVVITMLIKFINELSNSNQILLRNFITVSNQVFNYVNEWSKK